MNTLRLSALIGVCALGLACSSASAGVYDPALDQVISINDGDSFDVTGAPITFSVTLDPSDNPIVGFSFEGTIFINPTGFPGLPSHTQLQITLPDSSTYIVGGTTGFDNPWDFQSAVDANHATYQHGPDFNLPDLLPGGTWQFTFVRTAGFATASWSDVTITLHSIPSPGAVTLLAMGVIGSRRRRRA